LHALTKTLKAYDCVVAVDLQQRCLKFDLSERDLAWVKTGGLKKLLLRYQDVVSWEPKFALELPDRRAAKRSRALPAPRQP
jgi:hypothetical protein